jgi:hypothetical protein
VLRVSHDLLHVCRRNHLVAARGLEGDLREMDGTAEQGVAGGQLQFRQGMRAEHVRYGLMPLEHRRFGRYAMQGIQQFHRQASAKAFALRVGGEHVRRVMFEVPRVLKGTRVATE